jgi:hypothetical protein
MIRLPKTFWKEGARSAGDVLELEIDRGETFAPLGDVDVGDVSLMVEEHLGQGVQRAGFVGRLDHQGQGNLTLYALAHRLECISSLDYLLRSTLAPITTTSNIFYLAFVPFPSAWRPQPQRGVLGLHGLPHYGDQLGAQCVQVRFVA